MLDKFIEIDETANLSLLCIEGKPDEDTQDIWDDIVGGYTEISNGGERVIIMIQEKARKEQKKSFISALRVARALWYLSPVARAEALKDLSVSVKTPEKLDARISNEEAMLLSNEQPKKETNTKTNWYTIIAGLDANHGINIKEGETCVRKFAEIIAAVTKKVEEQARQAKRNQKQGRNGRR